MPTTGYWRAVLRVQALAVGTLATGTDTLTQPVRSRWGVTLRSMRAITGCCLAGGQLLVKRAARVSGWGRMEWSCGHACVLGASCMPWNLLATATMMWEGP